MNKNFFKQFAIALLLFLLGYFTFNGKLFAAESGSISSTQARGEARGAIN
jgi:hypothetical protein